MYLNVRIKGLDRAMESLSFFRVRLQRTAPLMEEIGRILEVSVRHNFAAGGRPRRWVPSKRALREGNLTLVDTGLLASSISSCARDGEVSVGTDVPYAAVHQFGARAGSLGRAVVRSRRRLANGRLAPGRRRVVPIPFGDIPARPFLVVLEEDKAAIVEAVNRFLEPG
ncbi:MAG: phage virion morphogenesis protein [Deltaproteobacteria bacterium]|nr:phage virion morphogenesis protein [Deltaproteobacteria bacterium]